MGNMARKNIAVFTALPESVLARNMITGVTKQCLKYDYNVFVYASMIHLESELKEYLRGEKKVYDLADLGRMDGVILDMANLAEGKDQGLVAEVRNALKRRPEIPVVTLDIPVDDYPVIPNHNEECLREMARHAIERHGKKRICVLTGQKGYPISESRLGILLDEIKKHGLTVEEEHIIYGDFWYDSGDQLARELLEGKRSMPDAVLCTSDYTAIAILDRLAGSRIRVPEDLLVMGFDTTDEGRCKDTVLSSFGTGDAAMAGAAVDYLRKVMEPGAEIWPYCFDPKTAFHPGGSCGCQPDYRSSMESLRRISYFSSHNSMVESGSSVDFGLLMESYQMENFAAANTPEECIQSIGESAALFRPFREFSLYMREDWLEGTADKRSGQFGRPAKMKKELSVKGSESEGEPCVFYYTAVHFKGDFMGYAILRRALKDGVLLDQVYRTWLRFVNNALEMVRAKRQLMVLSVRDGMTGLYNRRGMETRIREMLERAGKEDALFVAVIDMDGLKAINDTYGHAEGDFGIRVISSAVARTARENEISVRAGGDEFYVMGVGTYEEKDGEERSQEFLNILERLSEGFQKPYAVRASIGYAVEAVSPALNVDAIISKADANMYRAKVAKKIQRF